MANPYGTFQSNWKHELSIRSIKMVDIGYLFAMSSILGYIVARILSGIFKFNKTNYEKNTKGKFKLFVEIFLEMALIGIIIYACKLYFEFCIFLLILKSIIIKKK